MSEWLTTGQMVHQLKLGQKAEVVANGYVGGRVYVYVYPNTEYKEIRWEGSSNILQIAGYVIESRWKIIS